MAKEGSEDKNVDVRVASMSVASTLPVDQSVSILEKGLYDENSFVQEEALKGLAKLNLPAEQSVSIFQKGLYNNNSLVQEEAVKVLVKNKKKEILFNIYDSNWAPQAAHQEILRQAGNVRGELGLQMLQKAFEQRGVESDIIAVESASKIGGPESLKFLIEMYDASQRLYENERKRKVKAAIIDAINRVDGPQQVKSRLLKKAIRDKIIRGR